MSKKLVLHVALASMVLGSAPVFATDPPPSVSERIQAAFKAHPVLVKSVVVPSLLLVAASAFALKHNHPKPNFEQKGEWKKLFKINWLLSKQPRKEYFQNMSDVFWTRWIGQEHKSGYLELDKATDTVKPTKKCLPAGVGGKTSTLLHEAQKAGEMVITLGIAYKFLSDPAGFLNWVMTPFSSPQAPEASELETLNLENARLEKEKNLFEIEELRARAATRAS